LLFSFPCRNKRVWKSEQRELSWALCL